VVVPAGGGEFGYGSIKNHQEAELEAGGGAGGAREAFLQKGSPASYRLSNQKKAAEENGGGENDSGPNTKENFVVGP